MAAETIWWRNSVVYQIYPRSFADSNGDGIGDLQGIIQKLDYLAALGVEAVWYSPFFTSPDADFGYDISNFNDIDPKFGTLADFDRLVSESHKRGIKLILDLVLNHTSTQHPWFQESRKGKDNSYSDWYIWRDAKPDGSLQNKWEAIFGTAAWEFDPQRGQYYYHMFYPQQADLNWRNPDVRKACLDVFRFWLDRGADGFRLDVFSNYFKHPDSWPVYTLNNHYTSRSASRFHCGDNDERLKVAAALLMTLRGTPFIYYGEEIGMRNIHVQRRYIQDRIGEKYWPIFDGRDKNRSPMQWNTKPYAGFSSVKSWLPVNPDYVKRNVEVQRADPKSLFNFYRRIIQLRKDLPALRRGIFQPVTFEPRKILSYLRRDRDQIVLVALNFSRRPVRLALGGEMLRHDWSLVLSNHRDKLPPIEKGGYLPLLGDEAMILTAKS